MSALSSARHRGDRRSHRSPSFSWGVFGAFGLSRAVPASRRIRAIYGKLIPRNPHQGHIGSTRNDGVGGSSPPVGFRSSSCWWWGLGRFGALLGGGHG
jgi:hypothetical protein